MKQIHSIRTKILIIVLAFLSAIGAAFVVYSITTTGNYKRLRLDGIKKTVEFETEKVNKTTTWMEHGVIDLATDGLLFYETQNFNIGEKAVLEYLRSFQIPKACGFWFEPYAYNSGKLRAGIYAYMDREKGEALLDIFDMDEYDYHSMDWYNEIINAIAQPYQAVWTKTYLDDSNFLMTTTGSGIFNKDGKLIGISILDWVIEEVVNELAAIKPTENSFVLLCYPGKDSVISGTHPSIEAGASIKNIPWDINAVSIKLEDVNYLRFGRLIDNGWLLSVYIPENEIFAVAEKQNNRFSLLIASSSITMLLLAFLLISKLINAPIKHLTSEVSQLAIGNLDTQITISSKDELGLLADTFNKMTSDLKKSIEETLRERAEKERIGAELNVAKTIQASMLPCIFPPFPNRNEFDLFASMLPAKEVGGDFYDFYFVDNDNLAVVIADVSGKGVPAALFMVIAKTLIKNSSEGMNPKEVFESVNKKLCEGNDTSMFVTAFLGFLNIPTGRFVYVNAGHNPPLLKKGGEYEYLKNEPCLILGCMEDAEYQKEEIMLESGDSLYLYTDGVTEAMNKKREFFGEERLQTVINKYKDSPPKELLHEIKKEVDIFAEGAEQADDITMLAIHITP